MLRAVIQTFGSWTKPGTDQVLSCDWLPAAASGHDHFSQTLSHVLHAAGEGKHRHDFTGYCDIKLGLEEMWVPLSMKLFIKKKKLVQSIQDYGSLLSFSVADCKLWMQQLIQRNPKLISCSVNLGNKLLYLSCISFFRWCLTNSDSP